MHFALVFETGHVSDAQADQITEALRLQQCLHLAPAWSRLAVDVKRYAKVSDVPDDGMIQKYVDGALDTPNALAYHTEQDGRIVSLIGCDVIMTSGGNVMADGNSISSAGSHETCEASIDPDCNMLWQAPDGNSYDGENSDPVQDGFYFIGGVAVSNFILPAWADPQATAGPFDRLGTLKAPFTKTPGGYIVYVDASGQQQQLGKRPPWKPYSVRSLLRNAKRGLK